MPIESRPGINGRFHRCLRVTSHLTPCLRGPSNRASTDRPRSHGGIQELLSRRPKTGSQTDPGGSHFLDERHGVSGEAQRIVVERLSQQCLIAHPQEEARAASPRRQVLCFSIRGKDSPSLIRIVEGSGIDTLYIGVATAGEVKESLSIRKELRKVMP